MRSHEAVRAVRQPDDRSDLLHHCGDPTPTKGTRLTRPWRSLLLVKLIAHLLTLQERRLKKQEAREEAERQAEAARHEIEETDDERDDLEEDIEITHF